MAARFTLGERWRLGLIAAVWAVDLALLPFAPFRVVWSSFAPVALWVVVLALVAVIYTRWRPERALANAARATAEILVFVLGAALANYLGFMAGRPLFDGQLVAVDALVGFDWPSFVAWLGGLPHVNTVLLLAYESSLLQVTLIVIFLALSGRRAALDRFLIAFMVSALVTVIVWTLFPTFGAYVYYLAEGRVVSADGLAVDPGYAQTLLAMHAGHFAPFSFATIVGLVGFPSFHTCLAVLCAFALWGVRRLGLPVLALNVLVLFSVPAQGGHHLADVVGGVVTVVLAMALARRLLAPAEGARPATALAASRSHA